MRLVFATSSRASNVLTEQWYSLESFTLRIKGRSSMVLQRGGMQRKAREIYMKIWKIVNASQECDIFKFILNNLWFILERKRKRQRKGKIKIELYIYNFMRRVMCVIFEE